MDFGFPFDGDDPRELERTYALRRRSVPPTARSFRDFVELEEELQAGPAIAPSVTGDSMERGAGVWERTRQLPGAARQFVGSGLERVSENIGNTLDLPQVAARALTGQPLDQEGWVERNITTPFSRFAREKIAGGDPENAVEMAGALLGSLGGEVASLYGGGAATKAALGATKLGTRAMQVGAQAAARLPGTVLPTTAREVAFATPYNVANAMDEKDSMAGVASEMLPEDWEKSRAVAEWFNQNPGTRLLGETVMDFGLSGVINAGQAAWRANRQALDAQAGRAGVSDLRPGPSQLDAARRDRSVLAPGGVNLLGPGTAPDSRMLGPGAPVRQELTEELITPEQILAGGVDFRSPGSGARASAARYGERAPGLDIREPEPVREPLITPAPWRSDRARSAVSRTTQALEPTGGPREEMLYPQSPVDPEGRLARRSATSRTTAGLSATGRGINAPEYTRPLDEIATEARQDQAARDLLQSPGEPQYVLNEELMEPLDPALRPADPSAPQGDLFGAPQSLEAARRASAAGYRGDGPSQIEVFADDAARVTLENGGATIDPVSGANRAGTEAYAVAAYPDRELRIPLPKDQAGVKQAIAKYTGDNWDLLKEEGNEFGSWVDRETGELVMDVSRVYLDRDEALAAMRANNEKAAFDLKNFEDLPNPDFDAAARQGSAVPREEAMEEAGGMARQLDEMGQELGAVARQGDRERAIKEAIAQMGIATASGAAVAAGQGDEGVLMEGLGSIGLALVAPGMIKGATRDQVVKAASALVSSPREYGAALLHRGLTGEQWQKAMAEKFGEVPEGLMEESATAYARALDKVVDAPHMAGKVFDDEGAVRMSSFEELVELARGGRSYEADDWYEGVYPTLVKHLGEKDAEMFVRFLAATSPQAPATNHNIIFAKKAFIQWKMGEKFLSSGRYPSPWDGGTGRMLNDAVKSEVFGDSKIQNYYRALMGDPDAVVIDDWMSRALGWGQVSRQVPDPKNPGKMKDELLKFDPEARTFRSTKGRDKGKPIGGFVSGTGEKVGGISYGGVVPGALKTVDFYQFAEQLVRQVADEVGMTPRQAQASIWGALKKIYEERGWSIKDTVEPYRRSLDASMTKSKTDTDKLFRAVVEDTLNDPSVAKLKGAFQKDHAQKILAAAKKHAKDNGIDVNSLLRTLAITGVPLATSGFTFDDERKNQGALALALIAGAHTAGKYGAFKPLAPAGEKLWDTLVANPAGKVREKANKLTGGAFRREGDAGPEWTNVKDAARRTISEWSMRANELQKRTDQYGEAFQKILSKGIDEGWNADQFGAALRGEGLDAADAKVIEDIHSVFEGLGNTMLAQGWISSEAFERWTGKYAPRLYNDDSLLGRKSGTASRAGAEFAPDGKSGLDRVRYRAEDPNPDLDMIENGGYRAAVGMIQEGHLTAVGKMMETAAGNQKWTNHKFLELGQRLKSLEAQRIALGEADEAVDPARIKALDEHKARTEQEMKDLGFELQREGWVQMPNDARYGALRNQWVKPEIKADLESFVDLQNELGKVFSMYEKYMLRPWKKAKTIWNPATHGRNFVGAQLLSYLGNGPIPFSADFWKAAKAVKDGKGDLYKLARENGLLDAGSANAIQLPSSSVKRPTSTVKGVAKKGVQAIKNTDAKLTHWYQYGDIVPRVAHFEHAMRVRGMSVAEAAADAKKWVPTYDNLSRFSRLYSKFGAPFWAYTAVALPRVAEATVKHPIRFMTFGALAYASEKLFTDQDVPKDIMPPEMRGAGAGTPMELLPEPVQNVFNFMFPTRITSPFGNSDRRRTYLDATYLLPYGDIAEGRGRDTSLFGPIPNQFSPMNIGGPFVKQAMEIGFNKVHFSGRPIIRPGNTRGQNAKSVADYFVASNLPSLTPTIPGVTEGGYGFQRIRDAVLKRPNYMGDTRHPISAGLDAIGGLKQRQIDLPVELNRRVFKLQQEIRDTRAVLRNTLSDPNASEASKEKERREKTEQMQRLQSQIRSLITQGRSIGIRPERIR